MPAFREEPRQYRYTSLVLSFRPLASWHASRSPFDHLPLAATGRISEPTDRCLAKSGVEGRHQNVIIAYSTVVAQPVRVREPLTSASAKCVAKVMNGPRTARASAPLGAGHAGQERTDSAIFGAARAAKNACSLTQGGAGCVPRASAPTAVLPVAWTGTEFAALCRAPTPMLYSQP